jgi:Tol biopolymer transport system component
MTPSATQVLEQLERMLQSSAFRGAARSSTLLRFLVEQTLAGHADRLKDYTLGAEALGRGDAFDPRTDPIARVEASRLRSRLELYYATEGASDPVVITLRKGGYVPVFEARAADPVPIPPEPPRGRTWPAGAVFAVMAMAVVTMAAVLLPIVRPAADRPGEEMRPEYTTPPTTDPVSLALSPDGRTLVAVVSGGETPRLWVRAVRSPSPTMDGAAFTFRPLPGTEHASLPFWSPDSRSVGFFADSWLKTIDLDSGLVRSLAKAEVPAGATWSLHDTILYARVPDSPLFRVPARVGGTPQPVTMLAPGHTGHRAPHFLPDGRHFLYFVFGSTAVRGVYVGHLDDGAVRRLVADADTPAVYAAGHMFYLRQGALFAHGFDPVRLSMTGHPQRIAAQVASHRQSGVAALSVSDEGEIAYRTGPAGGQRQLVWKDRSGAELARVGQPESRGPFYASISPDRNRLAVQRTHDGNTDIYFLDLERDDASPFPFTDEPQADIAPHFWADQLVYSSHDDGVFSLHVRPLTGGPSEVLLDTRQSMQATDVSRDGRFLLYRSLDPDMDWDIWALPLDRQSEEFPVVQTRHEERDAQFSPNGRFIAYQSNARGGRFEIYVRPFPGPGEARPISANGGVQARWREDGSELFYITLDGQLVAVPITWSSDGQVLEAGVEEPLFPARVGAVQDVALPHYIVSADGQRFLLDTVVEEPAAPITIILDWTPAAR